MVEAKENSAAVNAQRANDMRESTEFATGTKEAPTVQANELVPTGPVDLVRTNQATPATTPATTTTQPIPPPPPPTSELSSLHTRLMIAGILVVVLFILWIYQRRH